MSKHFIQKTIGCILCAALCMGAFSGCGKASTEAGSDSKASVTTAAPAEKEQPEVFREALTGTVLDAQDTTRPAAVIISNKPETAVRQWGIGSASVVMEALTEGKTTNFMLWYNSLADVPKVGPVGEGKDTFWQFAMAENSILAERGSNTYAFNLMNAYNYQPIDALYVGVNCFDYDGSDPAIADEFSWYTRGSSLQNVLGQYNISETGDVPTWLNFGEASGGADNAVALTVAYSTESSTVLRYENGRYAMYDQTGAARMDANDGTQCAFDNVLILQCEASVKDDKYTREYDLTGGSGLYLTKGTWQTITWTKGDVGDALKLYAANGNELTVNIGTSYVGIYGGFNGQSLALADANGTLLYDGSAQA